MKIKERNSNFELMRIILIILIITGHYIVNSNIQDLIYKDVFNAKSIFYLIIGGFGKTIINAFVLITGYFMCQKEITVKKFLKLLLEIEFYSILLYAITVLLGYNSFDFKRMVLVLIPIREVKSNFSECFVIFYLFIPFINIVIKNITEKQHIILILLLVFVYSIIGFFPNTINMNYLSIFTLVYLIGAYIRIYNKKIFDSKKFSLLFLIVSLFIMILGVIFFAYICTKNDKRAALYFISDSNKPWAIIMAISIFLFFKNIKIKNSKIINRIASSVFGILLIHTSGNTADILWNRIFKNSYYYNKSYYFCHLLVCVLVVFIVGLLIDQLRQNFIEKPLFNIYDKKIKTK